MEASAMHDLQRANARLTKLIANLDGGVLLEDETRHIVLVNQAFCTMFNIPAPPEALIGVDCSDSAEASKMLFVDSEGFVMGINMLLQARQQVIGDVLHLVDGRVFERDYVPIYFADTYIGHLWHYHDKTSSFHARYRLERLLEIEAVNREIIRLFLQHEQIDDAVNMALALTGQVLDVSRVYVFRFRLNERRLDNTHEWCAPGVKSEIDHLQRLPFDELAPSLYPLIVQYDLIAPHHIDELPEDLRYMLAQTEVQAVLWVPLHVADRLEGFVGYHETRRPRTWLPEEITMIRVIAESYARALEREQTSSVLVHARDEAIRTARLRSQFVANMSHEIRTPMTSIMAMLELLLETPLGGQQREFAAEAFKSTTQLLDIINDILDFSKLEAGQFVLHVDSIDVKAIATEVQMTLAPQVREKPIEFVLSIDPAIPYRLYGDATRIRQVLMNLAGNAVKFTPAGHVTIDISVARVFEEFAAIRFAVHDTGIGIAPEHLERIFESFVQVDSSTTRKYGGSGLGLSISKQLVELMGGTLQVESMLGVGSTFSFVLRLPIARATSSQTAPQADFSSLEVAIMDSSRTARYVLAQQLESWSCKVMQVYDVNELQTLAQQRTRPLDVLFLRYPTAHPDELNGTLPPVVARQLVYITDGTVEVQGHAALYLTWPIDQSILYNVLLQVMQQAPTEPREALEPLAAPTPTIRRRVLVADDYPANVSLVQGVLAKLAIEVDVATNGEEALKQLEQASYDLVLMDIQMPVMDGMETTRRIRQSNQPYRNVPIIALTANVMREQQDEYLALGVDDILSKPFSIKHLREVVQRWLDHRRAPTAEV
ncbi:MAG: response regulator [Chloroflexaceae bacterium]|nr:response regulator [Chloroflexaceae bacterium]